MTPAATRRTTAAVVTVWVVGLLLVLGLWQSVEASCGDEAAARAPAHCAAEVDASTTDTR